MSLRQIVLDTETTGLDPKQGHRIIEVGGVELVDRRLTGRHLHFYINPEREIEAEALAVHGITNQFLQDKPLFAEVAESLIDYIDGAELIIHNAPFDIGFLEHEFKLSKARIRKISLICTVTDTLVLARKIHPGQRNNLDALCKRYHIDNSRRELHGALLDAEILAKVYLAMTGGQATFFDASVDSEKQVEVVKSTVKAQRAHLKILKPTEEELLLHEASLQKMNNQVTRNFWADTPSEEI